MQGTLLMIMALDWTSFFQPWLLKAALIWTISTVGLNLLLFRYLLPWAEHYEENRAARPSEAWSAGPKAIAFAPIRWNARNGENSDWLIVGDRDGVIRLVNRKTGREKVSFLVDETHSNPISCLALCPRTGRIAVPGGIGNDIYLYNIADITALRGDQHPRCTIVRGDGMSIISALAFSSTGSRLAVAFASGNIAVYDLGRTTDAVPSAPCHYYGHTGPVLSVAFQPESDTIFVSGGEDRMLWLWGRRSQGEALQTYENASDVVSCVTFSPDGKTLAVVVGHRIELRDFSSDPATEFRTLPHPHARMVVCGASMLVSISEIDGKLWDMHSARAVGAQVGRGSDEREAITAKTLRTGGSYIALTHNDTSLLTVGRDQTSRKDNTVWEEPLRRMGLPDLSADTGNAIPLEEPLSSLLPVTDTDSFGRQAVVADPAARAPRRKLAPKRKPWTIRHKFGLAASLLLSFLPAYFASLSSGESPARGTQTAAYPDLKERVRKAEAQWQEAEQAPHGGKARLKWRTVLNTAEQKPVPDWIQRAKQEADDLQKKPSPRTTQTLDDLAEIQLIRARAYVALGNRKEAGKVARAMLGSYAAAKAPDLHGRPVSLDRAAQSRLKEIYAQIKPKKTSAPSRPSGSGR